MTINDGTAVTSARRVKLSIRADDPSLRSGPIEMCIKNGGGSPWTEWRTYAAWVDWKLSEGEGQKSVYVQFKDRAGNRSEPVKATITLQPRFGGRGRSGSGEGSIPTTGGADEPTAEPRGPDSGGVASPSSQVLEIFFGAYDPDAHTKFLRWRERNRRGYVIGRRLASDAMLHRAYCGHFEHTGTRAQA